MKKLCHILIGILLIHLISCKEEEDLSPLLTGYWKQYAVYVNETSLSLSPEELNTSLFMEANGVYRLYDGVTGQEHPGTWLFSDKEWLNMSMDKIIGQNSDGSLRFGQVLVRFTILSVDNTQLELRIKTYLFERKETVMFNLMEQDNISGMTGEEQIQLDTENKKLHTYRYVFKKVNL